MYVFSLKELYLHDLRELLDFERQKALFLCDAPGSISLDRLLSAMQACSKQTPAYSERLEAILCRHGASRHPAMQRASMTVLTVAEQGLFSMGDPELYDAVLVTFLRRTTHHELAACRCAMARAETLMLGLDRHSLLDIFTEKTAADAELESIEAEVNQLALMVSTPAYV